MIWYSFKYYEILNNMNRLKDTLIFNFDWLNKDNLKKDIIHDNKINDSDIDNSNDKNSDSKESELDNNYY